MRVTRTEDNESYFQSEPRGFMMFNYIENIESKLTRILIYLFIESKR